MTPQPLQTLLCTIPLPSSTLSRLKDSFKAVHYHPSPVSSSDIPSQALEEAEVVFTTRKGLPVETFEEIKRVRHWQLCSAGADGILGTPLFARYASGGSSGPDGAGQGQGDGHGDEVGHQISLSTSSGIHVISIPNYVVGMVVCLFHQIPKQILIGRNERRWMNGTEVEQTGGKYYARQTRGRTAGMLGYGALGRESARLLQAHGMEIIAANTSGKQTAQDGYRIPGTGDVDGSIPSQFYSTKDKESFEAFLKRCDVLVASLPNTKATSYILSAEKLALLPKNSLLINVGRGSLVKSDDLLAALDSPDGLFGAAIDVTDPEPLPDNHPLWSHPKCIVTPHLTGDAEGEMDLATSVLIDNVERLRKGEKAVNLVEFGRGY